MTMSLVTAAAVVLLLLGSVDAFRPIFLGRSTLPRRFSSTLSTDTAFAANGEEEERVEEIIESILPESEPKLGDFFPQEVERTTDGLTAEVYTNLPRHSNDNVNAILEKTERFIKSIHKYSNFDEGPDARNWLEAKEAAAYHDTIYANSYVDLGKVDVIGFDFDYTLVTYTDDLLDLIYEKALKRLVTERQYPMEMLDADAGMKFDRFFSIRGLAVDKEKGWITQLSYTHKVALAWEGREKVPTSRIMEEYRGKRALRPSERKQRLKPLNDLFSMAECCLIADTVQFFKDRAIPFCPQNVVTDVLKAVTDTHISGDFHRMVANDPEKYFEALPHLRDVLTKLKESGKSLIFASNSPFWYVDAGMRYVIGDDWRDLWEAVITSAGKPSFYTTDSRPFREVCQNTQRIMFHSVDEFESGKVYTEGCLKELIRLLGRNGPESMSVSSANVLYIGDSLFADLVDAKREFSWLTGAITPEVGYELELQTQEDFALAQKTIDLLLNALRLLQEELGTSAHTKEDTKLLDRLEKLVSLWRDRVTTLHGSPFGSIFRARYQPSLFAHSLKRYCDLYMPSVTSLRNYSPQHRFYPQQSHRLLAHECNGEQLCWTLEDLMDDEGLCG